MRSLSIRLFATLALALFASSGHAQQLINCATSTPCVNNGPTNTNTGDQLPTAGTKINANFQALPSELFNGSPLAVAHGGTGTTSPTVTQGSGITITGTWPNLTISATGGSTPPSPAYGTIYNNNGAYGSVLPGATGVYCLNWASLTAAPTLTTSCGGSGGAGFAAITTGTNTSATMTVGTGGTITYTGSGVNNASEIAGLVWPSLISGDCLTNNGTTLSWGACGSGGSSAFSSLTSGTNTTMAALCGTGCSIGVTGSGTNTATAAPLSGLSGLGTGVATFLATPTSANLFAAVTDETGSGSLVGATSPTLVTPALKGSSTGTTTFASLNASASNFTITFPAATGTLPYWVTTPVNGDCLQYSGTTGLVVPVACSSGAVSSVTAGASGSVSVSPTTGAVVVDLASQSAGTMCGNLTGSAGASTCGNTMASLQSALTAANALEVSATLASGATNNYSPTGYGTTTAILNLTPASGGSSLTGLAAGSATQQIFIINAEAAGGTDTITLTNQSSSSTAANRFLASGNLVIPPGGGVNCLYRASNSFWWCH
jgi:hypothetical protein